MKNPIVRIVKEGDPTPRGFGLAWWRAAGVAVYLPLGINLLAAAVRRAWMSAQLGARPSYLEKWIIASGKQAHAEGYDKAIQDVQLQVEARFGERVRLEFMKAGDQAEVIGKATADATELEQWTAEQRQFFLAAQRLAQSCGDSLILACQDKRCAMQPVLMRVEAEDKSGFWLVCMHKRRWVPYTDGRRDFSGRAMRRLGLN